MGSSSCTVRVAAATDFEAVTEVFKQENAFHVALLPGYVATTDSPIGYEEFLAALESDDMEVLVAEADGAIVGAAQVAVKSSAPMRFLVRRRYAYVMDVSVDEQHRGKGVGRALMDVVIGWAREKGVRDIELNVWEDNEDAISFYESLGFASLDRRMTKRL